MAPRSNDSATLAARHISQVSRRMLASISTVMRKPEKHRASASFSSLEYSVPYPRPIVRELLSIGLTQEMAEKLSKLYIDHAIQFKRGHESFVRVQSQIWMQYAVPSDDHSRLLESFHKTFTSQYLSKLEFHRGELLAMVHTRVKDILSASHSKQAIKSQFKQSAIPMLEAAYAKNPYPSRGEKESLADATGMDYKQIHIWFQNKRARAKKDGSERKKGAELIPTQIAGCKSQSLLFHVKTLLNNMIKQPQQQLRRIPPDITSLPCGPVDATMLLEPEGALHAFPSLYPPTCAYDPFPIKDASTRNFSLPWLRKVATREFSPSAQVVDIDSLAYQFSCMSIAEASDGLLGEKPSRPFATAASYIVVPSPAPLPALLRPPSKSSMPSATVTRVTVTSYRSSKMLASLPIPTFVDGHGTAAPEKSPEANWQSCSETLLIPSSPEPQIFAHRTSCRPPLSRSPSIASVSSTASLDSLASSPSTASETSLITPPPSPREDTIKLPVMSKWLSEQVSNILVASDA